MELLPDHRLAVLAVVTMAVVTMAVGCGIVGCTALQT
jgi:hypothetical protein